jgi:uncharacterized protein (DUF4415 family)
MVFYATHKIREGGTSGLQTETFRCIFVRMKQVKTQTPRKPSAGSKRLRGRPKVENSKGNATLRLDQEMIDDLEACDLETGHNGRSALIRRFIAEGLQRWRAQKTA